MHIAHLYDGTNVVVYVNGTSRRNWSKSDINTGDTFPLQFGRWTDENRYDRTFNGLIDDFRVYDEALKFSDIQNLYGNGNGDFKITPVFDIDSVVEESPAIGNLEFYRNGKRLKVNGLTIDDLSITNGRITFRRTRRESCLPV